MTNCCRVLGLRNQQLRRHLSQIVENLLQILSKRIIVGMQEAKKRFESASAFDPEFDAIEPLGIIVERFAVFLY